MCYIGNQSPQRPAAAATYAEVSWPLIQVFETLFPVFGLPNSAGCFWMI